MFIDCKWVDTRWQSEECEIVLVYITGRMVSSWGHGTLSSTPWMNGQRLIRDKTVSPSWYDTSLHQP